MKISWSRSPVKVNFYHGSHKIKHIKVHGKINPDCINYIMTLVKEISFSFSQKKFLFNF